MITTEQGDRLDTIANRAYILTGRTNNLSEAIRTIIWANRRIAAVNLVFEDGVVLQTPDIIAGEFSRYTPFPPPPEGLILRTGIYTPPQEPFVPIYPPGRIFSREFDTEFA